jgi:hypothetical protein
MVFWVSLASFRVSQVVNGADDSHGSEQGYEASSKVHRVLKGEYDRLL